MSTGSLIAAAVNLNGPGRYLHWSIFIVSEANLVLIAVMVVIFGAALAPPFPGHGPRQRADREGRDDDAAEPGMEPTAGRRLCGRPGDDADAAMWTARVRRWRLRLLPPGKLLPDRQPAYVASWVYVFGVASLATLGLVILSGIVIALGGPDWWHTNPVGHFFNSLHLWSVEAFMAFLVIHLWGKFWMAAWRGGRSMTWITGVVAFVASIVECFTGYLSQQNFDSQWISTSGKDAFNAVGVGCVLQPHELRPDADVAHRADPDRARRPGRSPRARRAGTRGRPPAPGPPSPGAGGSAGGGRRRPGRVAGPDPALRHPEGSHRRHLVVARPRRRPGRPPVLSRRSARDDRHLGQDRPGRLRRHRRQRAGRHQRDRHLRSALQQRQRQHPEHPVLPGVHRRRAPADRRGQDLRALPAGEGGPHRSGPGRRARPLPRAPAAVADRVERRLCQGGDQGHVPRRRRRRAHGRRRTRSPS